MIWSKLEPSPSEPIFQQSRRLSIYHTFAKRLLDKGKAYKCYCTKERLEAIKSSGQTGYDGACRHPNLTYNDRPYVIRLRSNALSPAKSFRDQVFGSIPINPSQLDDVILVKSDGFPTYHFANVIDDHECRINLVMRGQEWLPSTPIHLAIYKAFEWDPPSFAHLPLLIRSDGSKLSKRHNDAFVEHYRQQGYMPEALLNFVALLGWNPSNATEEVLSMDQLVNSFSLERINRSESMVDVSKLNWLNRRHILNSKDSHRLVNELSNLLKGKYPNLIKYSFDPARVQTDEYLSKVISLITDRIYVIEDIPRLCPYFFIRPETSPRDDMAEQFCDHLISDDYQRAIDNVKLDNPSVKPVEIMMQLRMAITGQKVGASLVETCSLLGFKEVKARLERRR